MNVEYRSISTVKLLRDGAKKIVSADSIGDSVAFEKLGLEYGPIAYSVYRTIMKSKVPVMLSPWLVYNRTNSCDYDPETQGFWLNGDMVVGLVDFLDLIGVENIEEKITKEFENACT